MARLPSQERQQQLYATKAPKPGKQANGSRSDEAKAREKARAKARGKVKFGAM
jgi:hypothetical protein